MKMRCKECNMNINPYKDDEQKCYFCGTEYPVNININKETYEYMLSHNIPVEQLWYRDNNGTDIQMIERGSNMSGQFLMGED